MVSLFEGSRFVNRRIVSVLISVANHKCAFLIKSCGSIAVSGMECGMNETISHYLLFMSINAETS